MAKAKKESSSAVADPACAPEWTELLRQMILIRRFEEATEREFRKGKIGGYLHVYIGQEAIASRHRQRAERRTTSSSAAIAITPRRSPSAPIRTAVMAELFGKGTGLSKGKGGSMHLFDVEHGLYGGYGIVGGHLPLAVGAAYALRYQGTDRIAVCYFGDGAMNIGSFHEAMNMAGLWGHEGMCPIIFIIENNGYAMGTSLERHSALTDLSARVRAYDIPTEKVDGQDIFAVRGVADRVVAAGARDRQAVLHRGGDVPLLRSRRGGHPAAVSPEGRGREAPPARSDRHPAQPPRPRSAASPTTT